MKLTLLSTLTLLSSLTTAVRINPIKLTQVNISTGAADFDTVDGVISKSLSTGQATTTIYTFDFGTAHLGKTCTFGFDRAYERSGTKQADLFSVIGNPTSDTTGYPRQATRDNYLARFQVANDLYGPSVWTTPFVVGPPSGPCPQGVLSWEVVGAGDSVVIKHDNRFVPRGGYIPSGLFIEAN